MARVPTTPPAADPDELVPLGEVLRTLATLLPLNSRDFAADPLDAVLYAILVGWDCEEATTDPQHRCDEDCGADQTLPHVATRHRWTPEDVARLRRYRAAIRTAT